MNQRREVTPKFGTFLGVFTPSILTILGLIMYLRFGWVLGNLGLPLTILVVLMSSSITLITGLSASAIATNMHIGIGGEYFMIAHSLGLELGGAIGIPLYLCRTLSITFYSFGLAESLAVLWPVGWGAMPVYVIPLLTAAIIVVITALSGRSAALALKVQIPILIAVGLSLVALVLGILSRGFTAPEIEASYRSAPQGFWYVFAVFFPAVTGFTAGIGMSGDLKDPSRSIPRGTLLAVLTGAAVYVLVPVLLSVTRAIDPGELASPGIGVWVKVSLLGPVFVFAGMWGAILSSAFGSVLAGPRVLQALADDGLAPRFLARISRSGQPTIATWITGVIALAAVALGNLNAVAQFVTILFLTLYVIINFSAAIEHLVGDPSYRPTINVPWYVSLIGALGALFVMFLLNPIACGIATCIELCIFFVLRKKALSKRWGDVRAGMWLSIARFALLKLRKHTIEPRNWRPHIIVFTEDIAEQIDLIYIANCFNQNRGIVTACRIFEGTLPDLDVDLEGEEAKMNRVLGENDLIAFCETNVAPDVRTGIINIAQANGIAGLHSNTVMFGWPKNTDKLVSQLQIMRTIEKIERNTIIARLGHIDRNRYKRRIDLWWGGLENNGDLMLLLAHLLRMNREWERARIIVHSIVDSPAKRERMEQSLEELIQSVRIESETEVIVKSSGETISDIITRNSERADIVFIGLMIPGEGRELPYAERLMLLSKGLGSVIFVRNASKFSGSLV
ncbi:MAG: amino acid permease [bacterium]|nr:MAG: amino acid permease [bacterium]